MAINKLERLMEKEGLTVEELESIVKGAKTTRPTTVVLPISGKSFSYAYISDTHIGHNKFLLPLWDKFVKMVKTEKPDFIVHPGDHLEGMSNRPGHVYELSHIGFENQMDYAAQLYNQLSTPMYGIDGNHDGWYFAKADHGTIVGKHLEDKVAGYHHLGQMEGTVQVKNIKIRLFHGNDGTAYANSYKLQKLVESFSGGDKPEIVHSGHYHKALYQFLRNVHGFESGTLCGQTEFMRGKKIPAHIGFGFVTVYYDKHGVDRLVHEFVPGYEGRMN
jgi:predicted phosphodiesterase